MGRKVSAGLLAGLLIGLPMLVLGQAPPTPTTQCVSSAIAGGTPDVLTIPLLPCSVTTTLLMLKTGAAANVTATPILQMVGATAQVIVEGNGAALVAGELTANTTFLLSNNGTNWIKLNAPPAAGPTFAFVQSNTALQALTAGAFQFAYREGFAAPGDGGDATYFWSSSACSAADNGVQVAPAVGTGCWQILADGRGIPIGVWGQIGGTTPWNDTPIWNAADAACNVSWPTGVAKIVLVGRLTSKIKAFKPTCISIQGASEDTSIVTMVDAGTSTDILFQYNGSGPFTLRNLTFQCPIYDPATLAAPACTDVVRVGNTLGATIQSEYVRMEHLRIIGGQEGVRIVGARYVWVDPIFLDSQWSFGLVVAASNDTSTVETEQIHINNVYGVNSGQYCISLPANSPSPSATPLLASRNLHIGPNVDCEGGGFLASKFCIDFTGTGFDDGYITLTCRNAAFGGLELKRTTDTPALVPTGIHRVVIDVTDAGSIDAGWGLAISNPTSSATSGTISDIWATLRSSWTTAPPRQLVTAYSKGVIFTANGNDYQVMRAGTTANDAGPTTTALGQPDGTAVVSYRQAHVTASVGKQCFYLDASTRVKLTVSCNLLGWGGQLSGQGASDNAISSVDLQLTATVSQSLLFDRVDAGTTVTGMRIWGPGASTSNAGAYPLLSLCNHAATVYSGIDIEGGRWEELGPSSTGLITTSVNGCQFGTSASPYTGVRLHGVYMAGVDRVMNLNTASVVEGDGGSFKVTAAGGNEAFTGGANFSGSLSWNTPATLASAVALNTAGFRGWVNAGAGNFQFDRLLRGFSTSVPLNTAGNYGDTWMNRTPSGAVPNGWRLTTPSATAGTYTAY